MKQITLTSLSALSLATLAFGHANHNQDTDINHWDGARADGHAPIGVMGDHTHNTGEWMFSYRFMQMHMEDLYNGDSKVGSNGSGYMMAPTEMDMEMHMFGAMFAPTTNLTLMVMTNYIENSMEMEMTMSGMRVRPDMETKGWGDSSIGGLYKIYDDHKTRAHLGLQLSLPTGSTDETIDVGPMSIERHQPFGMQLGTGTYDLLPSITYLYQPAESWSYGAQLKGRIHLGRNDEGYSFGDSVEATAWAARNLNDWAAVSFRLAAKHWGSVDGDTDNTINQGMMATMSLPADTDNTGGTRLDAAVGLNLWHPQDGFRVATEFAVPVYQNLNGTQLGQDWTLSVGTQYAW